MRPKDRQTLEEILASTSDTLFPAKMGRKKVKVESKDSVGDTPLHVLARRGDIYAVRTLLKEGANPNAQGDMGETPLHIAVSAGHLDVVSLLLENGADPGIICEFGDSPVERAQNRGKEVIRLFSCSG